MAVGDPQPQPRSLCKPEGLTQRRQEAAFPHPSIALGEEGPAQAGLHSPYRPWPSYLVTDIPAPRGAGEAG